MFKEQTLPIVFQVYLGTSIITKFDKIWLLVLTFMKKVKKFLRDLSFRSIILIYYICEVKNFTICSETFTCFFTYIDVFPL